MIHPLVAQLYFTRDEWQRGLEGVSATDAIKHLGPMNCISWLVGHMAWDEQKYWFEHAQGKLLYPELKLRFAHGSPKSTPSFSEVLKMWQTVIRESQPFLDKLTSADLQAELLHGGKVVDQSCGSAMQRVIYHYWYHNGEAQAIRQIIGHRNLPEFVGEIEEKAPYRSEYGH